MITTTCKVSSKRRDQTMIEYVTSHSFRQGLTDDLLENGKGLDDREDEISITCATDYSHVRGTTIIFVPEGLTRVQGCSISDVLGIGRGWTGFFLDRDTFGVWGFRSDTESGRFRDRGFGSGRREVGDFLYNNSLGF